jgi:hypothetical protein
VAAYVVSAGKRWAQEGYFEGTNVILFFMSVEKRLSEQHSLNLTALYTPILELSPNTAEVTN